MLIKYNPLGSVDNSQLPQTPYPVYLLTGEEVFFLEQTTKEIIEYWKNQSEIEHKILYPSKADEWLEIADCINQYGFFSERTIIEARLDVKSLDKKLQNAITSFLEQSTLPGVLIIRAPNLSVKSTLSIQKKENILVVNHPKMSLQQQRQWLIKKLAQQKFEFEPASVEQILQYTHHNVLACSQVIEKLCSTHDRKVPLTESMVANHLSEQNNYGLFELIDACLSQNHTQVCKFIKAAKSQNMQPSLLLWVLTQEVRLRIALCNKLKQGTVFQEACKQLKIWGTRVPDYQKSCKNRLSSDFYPLLQACCRLELSIKSNTKDSHWLHLESIALNLAGFWDNVPCVT